MVDMEWEVQKPVVYRVKSDSRVFDIVSVAGGFSPSVDKTKTQHFISLAAKISDGMKIYLFKVGGSSDTLYGGESGSGNSLVLWEYSHRDDWY